MSRPTLARPIVRAGPPLATLAVVALAAAPARAHGSGDSDLLGWARLVPGALGLVAGGTALTRSRRSA